MTQKAKRTVTLPLGSKSYRFRVTPSKAIELEEELGQSITEWAMNLEEGKFKIKDVFAYLRVACETELTDETIDALIEEHGSFHILNELGHLIKPFYWGSKQSPEEAEAEAKNSKSPKA